MVKWQCLWQMMSLGDISSDFKGDDFDDFDDDEEEEEGGYGDDLL